MYVDLLAVIPAANIMVDCAIGSVTDRQIRIRPSSDPMGNSDSKLRPVIKRDNGAMFSCIGKMKRPIIAN